MRRTLLFFLLTSTLWAQTAHLNNIICTNDTCGITGGVFITGSQAGGLIVEENTTPLSGEIIFSVLPASGSGHVPLLEVTGGDMPVGGESYEIWAGGNIVPSQDNTYTLGGLQGVPASTNRWANTITVQVNGDTWPSTDAVGSLTNNGGGILSWNNTTGAICGSDGDIQYNNSGGCGADANLKWDYTNGILTIKPVNIASTAFLINQSHQNENALVMEVLDHSGTEVFAVNGAAAPTDPNYVLVEGLYPLGGSASVGTSANPFPTGYFTTITSTQASSPANAIVLSNGNFSVTGAGTVTAASGFITPGTFISNETGLSDAIFINGGTFTVTGGGSTAMSGSLNVGGPAIFTTSSMSIDGVSYTFPSSGTAGFLYNNGSNTLLWNPSTGSVSSLNGLAGALTIAGTSNEISVAQGGTTITLSTPQGICLSCNVTFGNITPDAASTYTLGTIGDPWSLIVGNELVNAGSTMELNGSVYNLPSATSGLLQNTSSLTDTWAWVGESSGSPISSLFATTFSTSTETISSSSSTALQVTGGGTFGGGVAGIGAAGVAVSGGSVCYIANGLTGQSVTTTIRNSAGTGTCTEIFTCGIKTGGTC